MTTTTKTVYATLMMTDTGKKNEAPTFKVTHIRDQAIGIADPGEKDFDEGKFVGKDDSFLSLFVKEKMAQQEGGQSRATGRRRKTRMNTRRRSQLGGRKKK